MKTFSLTMTAALFTAAILAASAPSFAEEEKRYGVIYNIAEDRKVEKVGGIYEPEGIDKYMKRRFDVFDSKLDEINTKLAALDAKLEMALAAKASEGKAQSATPGLVR